MRVLSNSLGTLVLPRVVESAPVEDTYRALILADNPVGYWRLGETSGTTLVDELGVHDGAYVGDVSFGVAGAIAPNTAVALGTGYASVPDSAELRPATNLTVECWAKSAGPGAFKYLVSKLATPGDSAAIAIYTAGTGTLAGYVSIQGYGLLVAPPVAGPFWTDEWVHVALTYDGATVRLYANGVEVSTQTQAGTVAYDQNLPLYIGAFEAGSNLFAGSLDEVAFYNTTLSPLQIAERAGA